MMQEYTFKSPYHKCKRLPFNVICINQHDNRAYCETVEYKGWEKEWINGHWTLESIQKMIDSGYLKKKR